MKSLRIINALFVCIFFLAAVSLYAQEQNTNNIMEQLNQELEKDKVFTPRELKTIEKPVKNMLDKGATKEGLKNMLEDLSKKEARKNPVGCPEEDRARVLNKRRLYQKLGIGQ